MSSTIYSLKTGYTITEGVQSQAASNATINTARSIAREQKASVIVEDWGTRECYRVTPAGRIWAAPKGWEPAWASEVDDPTESLARSVSRNRPAEYPREEPVSLSDILKGLE